MKIIITFCRTHSAPEKYEFSAEIKRKGVFYEKELACIAPLRLASELSCGKFADGVENSIRQMVVKYAQWK